MAIRRFTVEIDDVQDAGQSTTSPTSLTGITAAELSHKFGTGTPQTQPDYGEEKEMTAGKGASGVDVIGRTPSDLFATFINDPRVMVTLFVVLSFVITIGKTNDIKDFGLPLGMAAVLIVVWFVAGWIKGKLLR